MGHEIIHGFFHLHRDYQKQVRQCVRRFDTRVIRKELLSFGYHSAVIVDEINAYVLTELSGLKDTKLSDVRGLQIALDKIFKNYFGYELREKKTEFLLRQIHRIIL